MTHDFELPPKSLSLLASVGGVVTAIIAIASLNYLSKQLTSTDTVLKTEISTSHSDTNNKAAQAIAKLDAQSLALPGTPVIPSQVTVNTIPYVAPGVGALTPWDVATAHQAWLYFQRNWNKETGLVNSVDGYNTITMWDQASAIAAFVAARELNFISATEFDLKISKMLDTLASLPLYKGELPNKVYNSQTLTPVNYGHPDKKAEIGWSAIDLGRMAIWLKIVGTKYPQLKSKSDAVWQHWHVQRLTKDGQMYGASVIEGKEQYNQEGRLGYENYAAYGLKLWGLDVNEALDYQSDVAFANIYGKGVPFDQRNYENSGANNYVLSEPYILDGIETGFQTLPKAYADRVLAAQEARYHNTKQLTAVSEDNVDRPPYFVYSSLLVNGEPWATITETQEKHNNLRFLSSKAAIAWHVLYNNAYTRQLFDFVQKNLKSEKGWYNGFYEDLQQPNTSLTANNNGVILESLLYKHVGKPLTVWAGVKSGRASGKKSL